jgi:hypothetical protein
MRPDPQVCQRPRESFCGFSEWNSVKNAVISNFGSRAFFIPNLRLEDLPNRILLDFTRPTERIIPDIAIGRRR